MNVVSRKTLALVLALTALGLVSTPATADRERNRNREAMPQNFAPGTVSDRRISMDEAISRVLRQHGGRVLDAKDLGDQYRVKVLTRDNEVRIVNVDAQNGSMR